MASAAITLVAAGASHRQSSKANKENKRAQRANARRTEISNASTRRANIAAGRRASAQTVAQGVNQGVGGGSGVQGAAGAVISQSASVTGQSQVHRGLDSARFNALDRANTFTNRANTFTALNNVIQPFLPS